MYSFGQDVSFIRDNKLFRLRAAAIILHEDQILMVTSDTAPYYYSVGGAVELGETVEAAVVREVREETGLELEVERLACIHQNFFTDQLMGTERWHELAFYFLMRYQGEPLAQADSVSLTGGKERLEWVPLGDFGKARPAYPGFLKRIHAILAEPTPPLLATVEEPILSTERLVLLPVTESDIDDIYRNFTPEVTRYMSPPSARTRRDSEQFYASIEASRGQGTDYHFVIRDKERQTFVGVGGLHNLKRETPEVGIWTAKSTHGNHYGREAVGAIIDEARRLGYQALVYPVDRRNTPSRKIPEAFGGILLDGLRRETSGDGHELEIVTYLIRL